MATDDPGKIQSLSDGGVVAEHSPVEPFEFLAAPATSNEFNTARLRLIPIACFRIDDVRFKFDSSFVLPAIAPQLKALNNLLQKDANKGAPLSIFGHADPTFDGNFDLNSPTHQGGDEYNKTLSGRRAIAIYALLVRDAAIWNNLFSNRFGGDDWGEDSIRTMLDSTDPPAPSAGQGSSSSSFSSSATSADSAKNARARDIAHDSGQRQQLFLKYMNLLCEDLKLDKSKDFLARGAGPDQKGDVQGCSRFNPLLLFSQEDELEFKLGEQKKDKALLKTRNANNAPNRRVMVLVFRKGSQVVPSKWPCPTFKEGSAGCKKRFFSDGDTRRSTHAPGLDRKFTESKDTFACRFYQRISDNSPCQAATGLFGKLFMQVFDLDGRALLAKRKYTIRLSGDTDPTFTGVLNDDGILLHEFVPDGNYVLKVDGCDDESPMIVLDPSDPIPTVRCLETAALKVFITTTDGVPIEGAIVNVNGIGELKSDPDGVADFGLVKPGEFDFRATKADFVPDKGVTKDSASSSLVGGSDSSFFADVISLNDSANGKVLVANRKAKPVATLNAKKAPTVIKEIKGQLPGTRGLRSPATNGLPPSILPSSNSDSSTPVDAVTLIRSDLELTLEAITEPPGQPVTWSVVPNQSPATAPAFTPDAGGTKVQVKTDRSGSFSAVATVAGSTLRWNFVVVSVEVDVAKAQVKTAPFSAFEDAAVHIKSRPNPQGFNVPPDKVAAIVGDFVFGKQAWESELTVKLVGGGPQGNLGIDKVTPRYLQNLTGDFLAARYDKGAIGRSGLTNTPLGRILDAAGVAGSEPGPIVGVTPPPLVRPRWPVITEPGMVNVSFPNPADKSVVTIKMGDSPASGAFDAKISNSAGTQFATRLEGFLKFAAAVACWSTEAPNTIVVHAVTEWLADYNGRVEFPNGKSAAPEYKADFAHMTIVTPWGLIGAATGGLDAAHAGFETRNPLATTATNSAGQNNQF